MTTRSIEEDDALQAEGRDDEELEDVEDDEQQLLEEDDAETRRRYACEDLYVGATGRRRFF